MSRDCLLHYLICCIDGNCDMKQVYTPDGRLCLVEVKSCSFLLDVEDIKTLEELENSGNWVLKSALYKRVSEYMKTGKEIKTGEVMEQQQKEEAKNE